jgi:hypothetical protein
MYLDRWAYQERYREMLRESERDRLVRLVRIGRKGHSHPCRRGLAWLGRELVDWGWRLQQGQGCRRGAAPRRAAACNGPADEHLVL